MKLYNLNIVEKELNEMILDFPIRAINLYSAEYDIKPIDEYTSAKDFMSIFGEFSSKYHNSSLASKIRLMKSFNSSIYLSDYTSGITDEEDAILLMDYKTGNLHIVKVSDKEITEVDVFGRNIKFKLLPKAVNELNSDDAYTIVEYGLGNVIMENGLIEVLELYGKDYDLGAKTFLTSQLDGSDKIYGFKLVDGEFMVDGGGNSEYTITSLDADDLYYIYSEISYGISIYDEIIIEVLKNKNV